MVSLRVFALTGRLAPMLSHACDHLKEEERKKKKAHATGHGERVSVLG